MAEMDSYKPLAINRLPPFFSQTIENKRSVKSNFGRCVSFAEIAISPEQAS
jgi:hypothetical protein